MVHSVCEPFRIGSCRASAFTCCAFASTGVSASHVLFDKSYDVWGLLDITEDNKLFMTRGCMYGHHSTIIFVPIMTYFRYGKR